MIYLDNAATTFPKPPSVINEVRKCIGTYCGNPGRSSHGLAVKAAEKIFACRESISDLFSVGAPERVFFTLNTTYALNTAIKGILRRGDHVVISDMEHNSVLRPIFRLTKERVVTYDVFRTHTESSPVAEAERLIGRKTRLLVCTHCPNLTSALLPIRELGSLCRRNGVIFVVDAAQSAGHIPIDMEKDNIDILCLPGHKGLYGIQGCGAVCLAEGIIPDSLVEGGNGINSLEGCMPDFPPERFEAGTMPTPAIAALDEGIREIRRIGLDGIRRHEERLFYAFRERLEDLGGIKIYDPDSPGAVLLFSVDGIPSERVAAHLAKQGICVRGGYHCSALGHRTLGTPSDGAVRVSFGIFNKAEEADTFISVLSDIRNRTAPD